MTDQETRNRVFAHTTGALLGMSVVVWWLAIPMIVASVAWWAR
jgi:hypothetical protein